MIPDTPGARRPVLAWAASIREQSRATREDPMQVLKAILCAAVVFGSSAPAFADGCYNCSSSSSNGCQQCRYGDNKDETFAARKACENAGCKVTGTGSCSTAANVKVCSQKK